MSFKTRVNILNSRKHYNIEMNCLIRNFAVGRLRRFPEFFGSLRASSFDDVADGKYKNSSRKFTTIISRKVEENLCLVNNTSFYLQCARSRSKKSSRHQDNEDSEDEEEEDQVEKNFREGHQGDRQIKKIKVASLRLDSIVSSSTNKAKNQIEKMFYNGDIRVDGQKAKKKSQEIKDRVTIDIKKAKDPDNENMLIVHRIEILERSFNESNGLFILTVRSCKNLVIEAYVD